MKIDREREEAAAVIENFIDGKGGAWDWDDFIAIRRFEDDRVREIQALCIMTAEHYPTSSGWCNDEGLEKLREYVRELRGQQQ